MDGDTFDLEKLRTMMDMVRAMPPAPFFASWTMLSSDKALTFEAEGRKYAGAHPDFWAKLPESSNVAVVAEPFLHSLAGVEIIDLDNNWQARVEFGEALARATIP